eukprot:TRINITY_DN42740_c0_g1_i1.p1 TRINITY_DN42740_c0_g1~~TRINITY_DN42740_c0_g1_i1.p1  ORF type:complete len:504 (-),score=80.03 TRINITY_DN42740_c0_g1_i1:111-1454(-)
MALLIDPVGEVEASPSRPSTEDESNLVRSPRTSKSFLCGTPTSSAVAPEGRTSTPQVPATSDRKEERPTSPEVSPNKAASLGVRRSSGRLSLESRCGRLLDHLADEASPGRLRSKQHPAQAEQTPGLVVSVWGQETGRNDCFMPYFARKPMNFDGELSTITHAIGVMSHRGHKVHSPNQDEFFLLGRRESLLFGVFDGHGEEGHDVAHFCQTRLPTYLVKELRKGGGGDVVDWHGAVRNAFGELCSCVESELEEKARNSGTTASVVMLDRPAGATTGPLRLRSAFLGDSSVVQASRSLKSSGWSIKMKTDNHRPDREDEAHRILNAGGSIVPGYGDHCARLECETISLSMSRALGDNSAVQGGLSHEPEIPEELMLSEDEEHMILVCSDGIWDVIPPAQAVQFVGKFKAEQAQLAVERLVAKAQLRWQEGQTVVDDITAILVHCNFQ